MKSTVSLSTSVNPLAYIPSTSKKVAILVSKFYVLIQIPIDPHAYGSQQLTVYFFLSIYLKQSDDDYEHFLSFQVPSEKGTTS